MTEATAGESAAGSAGRRRWSVGDDGRGSQTHPELPSSFAVMAKAGDENFPVASRVLPRPVRAHLLSLYGFARLVDDVGDEVQGDRLRMLDEVEAELESVWLGRPVHHPLIAALKPTVKACALPIDPFRRLIEANRRDQLITRYQTFGELLRYCDLSANPVGELVLQVLGVATPRRISLSDSICSALQLVEHWQDVAEDYRRGRIYIPLEDLERFGVTEEDLGRPTAEPALKGLLEFEVERASALLAAGAPLIRTLPPRPALAVAAFVAGGRSALGAIADADFDVLGKRPRPRGDAVAAELAKTLLTARSRTPPEVRAAYRTCESITRRSAANFYYGIRLLSAAKRRAMCAVYAFARQVDDIGDAHEGAAERRLEGLKQMRELLCDPGDAAVAIALADATERFSLPTRAFQDLIDGVEMDVRGERYETIDELIVYCRRVAGSIGRLCLAIFGSSDPAAAMPLADDLGVAMQLTNILRDVREDLDRARVYLPLEDRRRFGCVDLLDSSPDAIGKLVGFEAARARDWFSQGLRLLALIDRRSAACVGAMAGIYERILKRIEHSPATVIEHRVALTPGEKTWVALRSLAAASGARR